MDTIWQIIPGFDNYEASNTGFIRNKNTLRILKSSSKNKYNHQIVGLYTDNKHYNCGVHVMILLTFKGPRPEGKQTRHLDGNPLNNNLSNLVYGTHGENTDDRVLHGTNKPGASNGNSKLSEEDVIKIRSYSSSGKSQRQIATIFSVSQTNVRDIIKKRIWKHI